MVNDILIHTQNLTRILPAEVPVTLVKNISITIPKGHFVVIKGPSGSGKSSLLYLLGLLDRPTSGKLWFDDTDTETLSDKELADVRLKKVGFVFQFHFLLPEFSALENVILPMQKLAKLSDKAMRERAKDLLSSLGLSDQINKIPKQLSGGQSQRVAIARALANEPELILADEPTGNLDSVSSDNVSQILRSLASEHNRTVITVTHDQTFAVNPDLLITIIDGEVK
jgi:lipoprotein-releasing system ATP-binding protein